MVRTVINTVIKYNKTLLLSLLCYLSQDPTNLQGKVQKHENFAAELAANQARVEGVTKTGQDLIDEDHYAKDTIQLVLHLLLIY